MVPTPRFFLRVLPRPDRFPRRLLDWYRLALVVVLLAAAVVVGIWVPGHLSCRDGLPSNSVWSVANTEGSDDCVGLVGDDYAFDMSRFHTVMSQLSDQNDSAGANCPPGATPVDIGLLVTLDSPNNDGSDLLELDGFAAAQAQANGPGCVHPVRVEVGNMGADEQAATEVAQKMKDDDQLVAVVGMGVSSDQSALAADLLGGGSDPVPMVADVISAEQFDAGGAPADQGVDFGGCATQHPGGVGDGNFYRVSYANSAEVSRLLGYLGGAPLDFIVTPTVRSDPYTCTTVPLAENAYHDQVPQVKFDPADASTVHQSATSICARSGPVTLLYAARGEDLPQFIQNINDEDVAGRCQPSSITVLSTDDASSMRVADPDPGSRQAREAALGSPIFERNGKLRLIYTPLAVPDLPNPNIQLQYLRSYVTGHDSSPTASTDLDDGVAIVAFDALRAVSRTTDDAIAATDAVTRGNVSGGLNSLSTGTVLDGASGSITLDIHNDRAGSPPLVRLCASSSDVNNSLPVSPGSPGDCAG